MNDEISGIYNWCPKCNKEVQVTNWILFKNRKPTGSRRYMFCRYGSRDPITRERIYCVEYFYGQSYDEWQGVGAFDAWCEIPE